MKVLLYILYVLLGIFIFLSIFAKLKKGNLVYINEPLQRNPMEGKLVEFVCSDEDKENSDGVKGYLVAVGETQPKKGSYVSFLKRLFDSVISFFGVGPPVSHTSSYCFL